MLTRNFIHLADTVRSFLYFLPLSSAVLKLSPINETFWCKWFEVWVFKGYSFARPNCGPDDHSIICFLWIIDLQKYLNHLLYDFNYEDVGSESSRWYYEISVKSMGIVLLAWWKITFNWRLRKLTLLLHSLHTILLEKSWSLELLGLHDRQLIRGDC